MPKPATISAPAHPLFRRILVVGGLLIAILAFAGMLYENIAEARDRRFNPTSGKRFDVGGFNMHIDCTGNGSPTVILDSGLGDTFLSWRKVQPQISQFVRVCSYDRAGLGYSDPSPRPRTSKVIAEELHALLQAAGVSPPYVLVGHSLGGYNVRLYQSLYPKEIVGIVLVDASHPDQENRFPPELKNMEGTWQREAEFLAYATPFGLTRLLGFCEDDPRDRAAECNFHSSHEAFAELKAFPQSAREAAATGTLGDLPLIVLSHDPDKPSSELSPDVAKPTNEAWEKMQEELARLSTRGTQMVAKNSAHYIQNDRPDLVIDAVHRVVEQARGSNALSPASLEKKGAESQIRSQP
jgi:pimeloyl-ACP methyl ester carboxylesterase